MFINKEHNQDYFHAAPPVALALAISSALYLIRTEYAIVRAVAVFTEIGIDIFPNQFAVRRDLKQPSKVPLANQRVAVRQVAARLKSSD